MKLFDTTANLCLSCCLVKLAEFKLFCWMVDIQAHS